MLLLLLPLLASLLPGSDNEVGLKEPMSFYVMQTSYFHNCSWAQVLGSAWLGELETHRWESNSHTVTYLWPWSRGNFSNEEITEFETFFHVLFTRFTAGVHNVVKQLQYEYPFVLQIVTGCELHSDSTSRGFFRKAYQGTDLLTFQNKSWLPAPQGGSRAQHTCSLLNHIGGLKETMHTILSDTCPRFLLGLLDAGKADIQQQVRPKAWLSSGSSPGPGRVLLVCHVSGFYPKPVWVKWMRDEQEQPSAQRHDILPHVDKTWYLRVTLDVMAEQADGLSCRVKHSSLRGQDIILYWEHSSPTGFIFLAVTVLVLALLAGLAFWFRKRWMNCDPPSTLLPLQ